MPVALRTGTLLDGSGNAPIQNAVVLIDGERITGVLRQHETPPPNYTLIDASRFTVTPGLIDVHVHILGSGDPHEDAFFTAGASTTLPDFTLECYKNALSSLHAGWTTLRDCACRDYADIAVRNAINAGKLVGPRLWTCGLGITSTAGHMDFEKFLAPHVTSGSPTALADDPTEGRKAVRQNLRYDVDFIKINATLTEHVRRYGMRCSPEMTRETMQAIIDEAHMHHRKVTAHCYGGEGATWAIEAGVDGIEHGFFLTDEQLDMMAERGTVLCPTLSVTGRFRELGPEAMDKPHFAAWRDKAIDAAWDTTARARAHGVQIICGSDASMPGVRHGGNGYELQMLVEAGLSAMDALVSATSGAAKALDIPDVGVIAPGHYADLVVVDGDPSLDITVLQDLQRVPLVIKGGEIVADRRTAVPHSVVAAD
ncbi:amidohydrolase family protein [Deinococcus yavapaiensis]|uniref:Imidazolonepropionase-like amidohydrolase n=1 Tax=Deinococcus yavapaiensis KR-236 TaxID=694435 RepID=A0A318SDD1_9DEIO|nr:amidohydrolase family protein [Deinococcus yavapaiensis]PYE50388.1 imidazolonepropionase-like amidohydrolase [Deinococcus yavapaiensis KR-236]